MTFKGVQGVLFQKTEFSSVITTSFLFEIFLSLVCCLVLSDPRIQRVGGGHKCSHLLPIYFHLPFNDVERTCEIILHIYVDEQCCSGCLLPATVDSISAPDMGVFSTLSSSCISNGPISHLSSYRHLYKSVFSGLLLIRSTPESIILE